MRRLACLLRALWYEIRHPRRSAAVVLVAALALPGCAHTQSVRHTAAVSLAATHAVLSAIDDVEAQIVCGVAGAPQAPMCIPASAARFWKDVSTKISLITSSRSQCRPTHRLFRRLRDDNRLRTRIAS